jgi:hypothetical protein
MRQFEMLLAQYMPAAERYAADKLMFLLKFSARRSALPAA